MTSVNINPAIEDLTLNQWMFESSPDCVKLLDLDGRLLEMNWNGQCAMEVDNFSGLCMEPWVSLWPEESSEAIRTSLDVARAGGIGRFTAFCPTAKGTPKWWDVTVTAVRDARGEIEKLLSVSRDITALQSAKEEQRQTAARLQFLFESAKIGEWELDLKTGVMTTTPSHDRCLGHADAVGVWTLDAFLQCVVARDRERVRGVFGAALKQQEAWLLECRVVWPDRSVHWIGMLGSAYSSANGSRLLGTIENISHRKRAEVLAEGQRKALEMAVADEPLKSILDVLARAAEEAAGETVMASVLLMDEDGRHLNAASAPSLPAAYVRAADGIPIGPEAGICGTAAFLRQSVLVPDIQQDPRCVVMRELAGANGLRSCWSQPIMSSQGKVLGTLAVYKDVVWEPSATERELMSLLLNTTALILDRHQEVVERRRAEQNLRRVADELEESNSRKTEFLATLAHELRNPLAPILSGLEIMDRSDGERDTVKRVRSMMARQANHMSHLIDDLLDVARITSGKLELRKERVLMQKIVATAIEASLPLIRAKKHDLQIHMADELFHLNADPTRIAQVISNLLNNAAKYTPEGGHISLTVERKDSTIRATVKDDGIGIPQEAIGTVFEMFAQVDQNIAKTQGGLGIGLTLVRRLVDLHGGTVTVSSEGAGKGSVFAVELPLELDQTQQHPLLGSDSTRRDRHTGDGLQVLVVDDNLDAGETLTALLEMHGHAAKAAQDGYQALELVRGFQPDVIFLDLGLPGMSGYEVAESIRRMPHLRNATLVALTGWGSDKDRERSQQAGFNHHLTKPADFATINGLLAQVTAVRAQ